jgi:hypothetical protein
MNVRVQLPTIATSGAALLGADAMHVNPIVGGAGAVALGLAPIVHQRREMKREARAESSAAFLLRLEEDLSPASLVSSVCGKAKRFATPKRLLRFL